MSKRPLFWALVGLVALLLCAVLFRVQARADYIARPLPSPEMRRAQQDSDGHPPRMDELLQKPLRVDGQTLYNLRYCPETETLCATLRRPNVKVLGLRLLHADGQEQSGYYLPSEIRYGVVKAYFEQVTHPERLQALDLISVGPPDASERFADYARIPLGQPETSALQSTSP